MNRGGPKENYPIAAAAALRRAIGYGTLARSLRFCVLPERSTSHTEVGESEAQLLVMGPKVVLLNGQALNQEFLHPLHIAAFPARQCEVVQGDCCLHMASAKVPLLYVQCALQKVPTSGHFTKLTVHASKIHQCRRRLY